MGELIFRGNFGVLVVLLAALVGVVLIYGAAPLDLEFFLENSSSVMNAKISLSGSLCSSLQ